MSTGHQRESAPSLWSKRRQATSQRPEEVMHASKITVIIKETEKTHKNCIVCMENPPIASLVMSFRLWSWVQVAGRGHLNRPFFNFYASIPKNKNCDKSSTTLTLMLIGRNDGGSIACREIKVEARRVRASLQGRSRVSDGNTSSSCCIIRCHVH